VRGSSLLCGVMMVLVMGAAAAQRPQRDRGGVQELRQVAPDGVTEGWILTYDNPDPDRAWERIGGTVVVARHGKVMRKWELMVRDWTFWAGGRDVAVEAGPLHGPAHCFLFSVKTGKQIEAFPGYCTEERPDAPAWVRALEKNWGNHPSGSTP